MSLARRNILPLEKAILSGYIRAQSPAECREAVWNEEGHCKLTWGAVPKQSSVSFQGHRYLYGDLCDYEPQFSLFCLESCHAACLSSRALYFHLPGSCLPKMWRERERERKSHLWRHPIFGIQKAKLEIQFSKLQSCLWVALRWGTLTCCLKKSWPRRRLGVGTWRDKQGDACVLQDQASTTVIHLSSRKHQ